MSRSLFAAVAAFSLIVSPAAAQTPGAPEPAPQSGQGGRRGLEGEALGYLALPALLVLTLLAGLLVGGGEEIPASP